MLSPLSGAGGPPLIQQNASEAEIFYNATGFLRCAGQGAVCWERLRSWPWGKSRCQGGLNDKAEPAKGAGRSGQTEQGTGADAGVGQAPRCHCHFYVDSPWGLQVQVSLDQRLDLTFITPLEASRSVWRWSRNGIRVSSSAGTSGGGGMGTKDLSPWIPVPRGWALPASLLGL